MAAGLTAAHRVGVVHRDFKSHNVMLVKPTGADEDMRVVITDFGLARRQTQNDSTSLSLSLTGENTISGTPAYMAPEQVEGGPVTPAADVYALGVVLYEMVTGVWPFMGDTPIDTAIKRLRELPPSPRVHVPELDAVWEAAILRCLGRRPEDRFASAGDVADALLGASTHPAPSSRAMESPAGTAPSSVRRSSRDAARRIRLVCCAPSRNRVKRRSVSSGARSCSASTRGSSRASGSRWPTRTAPAAPRGAASRSWTP